MFLKCDDKNIEAELLAIGELVTRHGGHIERGLTITANRGSMSAHVHGPCNPGKIIISVPMGLLVPLTPLNPVVSGDEFSIDPDPAHMSPVRIELGRRMIELYNLTGKAAQHRATFPWITFRNAPELLDALLPARTVRKTLQRRIDILHGTPDAAALDAFICETFLSTRAFGIPAAAGQQVAEMLMPIIDSLNHHCFGSPYQLPASAEEQQALRVQNRQPVTDRNECFMSYGSPDALDTFLVYGFVDRLAPFVRSIPLEIEISGGRRLIVDALPGYRSEQSIAPEVSDLTEFMPLAHRDADGNLHITQLMIPALHKPNALRRLLAVCIGNLSGPGASPVSVAKQVRRAEEQVLAANIDFYDGALRKLDAMSPRPEELSTQIREIAELQLCKLNKYWRDPSS